MKISQFKGKIVTPGIDTAEARFPSLVWGSKSKGFFERTWDLLGDAAEWIIFPDEVDLGQLANWSMRADLESKADEAARRMLL